jgi:3-dehydroquinate synthase
MTSPSSNGPRSSSPTARHTAPAASGGTNGAAGADYAFAAGFVYRLRFTRGVFDPRNDVLREVIGDARVGRTLVCVDGGVAAAWPALEDSITAYFASQQGASLPPLARIMSVPGGEAAKNDLSVFSDVMRAIHEERICRQSCVIAVGGGAMLDAVGFAAATAHRGVRLVRIPTTTLAQGDAGIGVKNGVNAYGKKNFIGAFAPPWAVINDEAFLVTLSDRDWRSGLSEAVKVALVKDRAFFEQIEAAAGCLRRRDESAVRPIVRRCAELHLRHIVEGGDPFEMSAQRPLDFGHWAAHKLEQMSGYRLRHGEAVAIGMAIDVQYSALIGTLAQPDADRILACLGALGFDLACAEMSDAALLEGLEEFREHLGGRLTIALLKSIGASVDVHEIDMAAMRGAIARTAGDPLAHRH